MLAMHGLRAIQQVVERQFVQRDDIGDAPARSRCIVLRRWRRANSACVGAMFSCVMGSILLHECE